MPETPSGGICLGCGALVAEIPESGACVTCGNLLMTRQARFRLGIAQLEPESEKSPAPMPPEVEEAAREPANSFAGKYILVRKIGVGGMGWVWKAWEIPLSRFVAIKFLRAPSGEYVLRFEREAKLAAALSHPNIVPVYEFGQAKGEYYLVVKFIDGPSLEAAKLEGPDLLRVMIAVCLAVHHAHEAGVIHRDIKPQNIMLTADGWPYVLDFGLAKHVEGGTELSQSGMIVGTPSFMSPEQAQGHSDRLDRRSDVYALGATLYAMATGHPPFEGENPVDVLVKVVKEEVVAPRRVKADIPAPLEAIILKALEKDPEQRYATAERLADDLRRLSAGETIVAHPPRRRLVPRFIRRNPGVSASLGVAALAVALALYFFMADRPSGPAPPPAPDPVEKARRDWRERFRRAGENVKPGEAGDAPHQAALAELLKPGAPGADTMEAVAWSQGLARQGEDRIQSLEEKAHSEWLARRDEASRLAGWARTMQSLLVGLPEEFSGARATFERLAARADRIASFRGLVTLTINVFPYAAIRSMKTRDRVFIQDGGVRDKGLGKPTDKDLTTPLVIQELEIDDYEVELVHPDHGARTVSLRKDEMEHEGKYLLKGSMAEGVLKLGRDP